MPNEQHIDLTTFSQEPAGGPDHAGHMGPIDRNGIGHAYCGYVGQPRRGIPHWWPVCSECEQIAGEIEERLAAQLEDVAS